MKNFRKADIYLDIPDWTVSNGFERFWAVYLKKKTLKNRARFERFV